VVDDEEMLRDIAQSILESMGLHVLLAKDGVEALELLHQHLDNSDQDDIDLVILDMTMPRMGGEECYNQLRSFAPDLPVIICSGYAESEVRTHFKSNDAIHFIQKPYLPETLEKNTKSIFSTT